MKKRLLKGGTIIKREGLRILDLGWDFSSEDGGEKVNLGDVTSGNLPDVPSLSDFDVIFFDPAEVSALWTDYLQPKRDGIFRTSPEEDRGLARGIINLMETRRKEMESFLTRGGVLFCKLRRTGRPLQIIRRDEKREINRYTCLTGTSKKVMLEKGNLVPNSGSRFEISRGDCPVITYLERFKDSLNYEVALRGSEVLENSGGELLAHNPAGYPVSFAFSEDNGEVVFLPAGNPAAVDGGKVLIDAAKDLVFSPPYRQPPWLDEYRLSAEEELISEIETLEQKISRLARQKTEKQEKLKDIKAVKGLLSSGTPYQLKTSLAGTLKRFGFETVEESSSADLLFINEAEASFAIAVGADPESSVGLEPYHRLVRGINELTIYEDSDPQGVIVVNGNSELEPEERENQLSEELIEGSNLYGFTVLKTIEVFERIKQAETDEASVRKGLIDLFQNG